VVLTGRRRGRWGRVGLALLLAGPGLPPAPAHAAPAFARVGALTLSNNADLVAAALAPGASHAYFLNAAGKITRVRLNDFTDQGTLTVANVTEVGAAAVDPGLGYLYFTAKIGGVVKLARVNTATFAHNAGADQLTLRTDAIPAPSGFAVDPVGHWGYVACAKSGATAPAEMVRVNLSAFSVSLRRNASFPDDLNTVAGVLVGSYFYGPSTTSYLVGRFAVGRVNTSTLALDGGNTQPSGAPARIAVADVGAGQAFFASTTGVVTRVDTSLFPTAAPLALAGAPTPGSAVIELENRYLFIGTTASPGRVRRVHLATFAEAGEVTLNTGENNLACAAHDDDTGYAYFGTRTNPARVVKMQLATFTAPVNLSPPTLTGTAAQGQTLTGTLGSWGGSPTGYTRQWRRCNSAGTACVDIAGATGTSYALTGADVTTRIRCRVTATNAIGSTSADSAATVAVQGSPIPLVSFSISPTSVGGGGTSVGTVTLASAAPNGGSAVSLTSADPSVADVPPSVTVSFGQTRANFSVTTYPVLADTPVLLSATSGGQTRGATLTVTLAHDEDAPRAYPNPFDPAAAGGVTLRGLPPAASVAIVAVDGRFVQTLRTTDAGTAGWDGRTQDGELVPSGIYLVVAEGRRPLKIAVQR
jgi:hypothetical protein